MRSESASQKLTDLLCVACFAVAIALPLLALALARESERQAANLEGDTSAFPDWSPLDSFPSRFTAYFEPRLGFRTLFVEWNNAVTVLLFRTTPSTRIRHNMLAGEESEESGGESPGKVWRGTDGWLFYFAPLSEESFLGRDPLGPSLVQQWTMYLKRRGERLSRAGIEYLLVIVPEKPTVYAGYLPAWLQAVRGVSRSEEVLRSLAAEPGGVDFIDLRGVFLAAIAARGTTEASEGNPGEALYHRTDTHWNELGAFIGYAEIVGHLRAQFPALAPLSLAEFDVSTRRGPGRGIARMLRLESWMEDDYIDLRPRRPRLAHSPGKPVEIDLDPATRARRSWAGYSKLRVTGHRELPRAVVLHDSFVGTYLEPFLSEHFSVVEYRWEISSDLADVIRAKPDLVLEIRTERLFDSHLPLDDGSLSRRF